VGGAEVWSGAAEVKDRIASVEIPASVLTVNDYILTLTGAEPGGTPATVANYSFGVVE
jgi:hypothetical protein